MAKFDMLKEYDTEAEFTKQVKKFLEHNNIFHYKASNRYQKGISDIICCYDGTFVALELKRKAGKSSPHQDNFIGKVIANGGRAGVCKSLLDVVTILGLFDNDDAADF